MAESITITGTVERINGTAPGLTAGISYDITANFPNGSFLLEKQIPSGWRYGPPVEVDAGLLVGQLFQGTYDPNTQVVWWHFTEPIAWRNCPGVSPPPNPLTIRIDPTTGMPIPPPPTGGGGSPPTSAPPAGGGGVA